MRTERHRGVAPILGGLLIVLGLVFLAQTTRLLPDWTAVYTGATVMAAIGAGFLTVYVTSPARWWALIPAGTMFSLAVTTAVVGLLPAPAVGAIFCLGMAATFGAVALVHAPGAPRTWAWIPAGVMAVLAAITLGASSLAPVFWPVVLILAGGYLVAAWALRQGHPGR